MERKLHLFTHSLHLLSNSTLTDYVLGIEAELN